MESLDLPLLLIYLNFCLSLMLIGKIFWAFYKSGAPVLTKLFFFVIYKSIYLHEKEIKWCDHSKTSYSAVVDSPKPFVFNPFGLPYPLMYIILLCSRLV